MKPFSRAQRVGGQIQRLLSEFIHKEVKDPRLAAVIITGIKMTRDLRIARIYYTVQSAMTAAGREAAAAGLESAKGYLKRSLAAELGLRYMPELQFFHDDSLDYGARIEQLLESLKSDHEPDRSPSEE
ncbi:MAG: 30S ribosome-binding factor RbfA [Desulfobacteraceae bacterium]|jgi:ribosome-binding factor A|nr:30S ribosome-binding factor RbfA [Desulfobacteraceae bacterium]